MVPENTPASSELVQRGPERVTQPTALAIDGPSGVGKSTIATGVSRRVPTAIVLPEYTDVLQDSAAFSALSMPKHGAGIEAHTAAARMWSAVDQERRRIGLKNWKATNACGISIVDTSPLMVLGFELLKEQQGQSTPLDKILESYLGLFETEALDFFMPAHWVFLEADPAVLSSRLKQRDPSRVHPLLERPEASRFFMEFNRNFYSRYLSSGSYIVLRTDLDPLPRVVEAVSGLVTTRADVANFGFIRFVKDLAEARSSARRAVGE